MALILVVDDSPTIRKVVSNILERAGYDVALAVDGQDAFDALQSGEVKADLVLLDFVMPRMNGFQFSRALHKEEALTKTPLVLMSAKAERIRDQFVQQTGALDAITKPFDADALVAVVQNALRRIHGGRASAEQLPAADEIGSVPPPSLELVKKEVKVANAVSARMVAAFGIDLAEKPLETLAAVLATGLTKEVLLGVHADIAPILPRIMRVAQLSGDLAIIPIGAILQMLEVEGQSGRLTLASEDREITAVFRGGLLDVVVSKGLPTEFRIGRYFVAAGLFTPDEIEEFAKSDVIPPLPELSSEDVSSFSSDDTIIATTADAAAKASSRKMDEGKAPETERRLDDSQGDVSEQEETTVEKQTGRLPLGLRLLAAGKIDEAHVRTSLTLQSSELIYEVLRWRKGRFVFHRQVPDLIADRAHLGLHIAPVAMEGFRRIDQWPLLEATLGSMDAVFVKDAAAFDGVGDDHDALETAIGRSVDGKRTVTEIIRHSFHSSFDACRVLAQFVQGGLVRRKVE